MATLPAWTNEVSDHVMDAQVIAKRAVLEDGVITPTEQSMLDAMHAAQVCITEVHNEITGYVTTIRTGRMPRRMVRAANEAA